MLVLWSASFVIAIFAFVLAVVKLSWRYMIVSTITSIPATSYFIGATNAWKYISLTPFILFILTVVFWFLEIRQK